MANIDFYRRNLNIDDLDELQRVFCNTLVETNYTYSFFVDWEKVTRNRDLFRNELALLSSLQGLANPKEHLRALIAKYPEVVRVLPLLLAEREKILKVLVALKPEYQHIIYDFRGGIYSKPEIDRIVDFCDKTGLLHILSSMDSTIDYMTGVEVGLDSNARKNRSGDFMEDAVDEILSSILTNKPHIKRVSQKQFKYIQRELAIPVSDGLKERKFDEVLIMNELGINIEINFYAGTGSKPSEIVESYISRKRELDSMGWRFVWITDGDGWRKMRNQLRRGLENFEYVLNLNMLGKGLLERIVLENG